MQACEWPPQAPILKKRTYDWLAAQLIVSIDQFGAVCHLSYERNEII
jgi:hypothetical protein